MIGSLRRWRRVGPTWSLHRISVRMPVLVADDDSDDSPPPLVDVDQPGYLPAFMRRPQPVPPPAELPFTGPSRRIPSSSSSSSSSMFSSVTSSQLAVNSQASLRGIEVSPFAQSAGSQAAVSPFSVGSRVPVPAPAGAQQLAVSSPFSLQRPPSIISPSAGEPTHFALGSRSTSSVRQRPNKRARM